jgi:predicted nucleic acid-binding protein
VGTVVLDTSVLLGLLDTADAHHQAAATLITDLTRAGSQFGLPASVLSEVLVSEARRDRPAVDRRHAQVVSMFGPVRPIDEEVAVAAAHLRAKHKSLRLPDALVIATGIVDDAEAILTADKRWASIDDRIEVLGS